jgi:hypothetical protein
VIQAIAMDASVAASQYVDVPTAAPILLLIGGESTESARSLVDALVSHRFQADVTLASIRQQFPANWAPAVPPFVHGCYLRCPSITDFLLLRDRLHAESELFHLRCYGILVIVDFSVNPDIQPVRNQIEPLFSDTDHYFFGYTNYRADSLTSDEITATFITFCEWGPRNIVTVFDKHASDLVIAAFTDNYQKLIHGADKASRAPSLLIPANSLTLLSDRAFATGALQDLVRADDPSKIPGVFEFMGLFEMQFPGVLREERLLDHLPPVGPEQVAGRREPE